MANTRINKYLAQSGQWSRRQADDLIAQGHVRINDRVAVLGDTVNTDDAVLVRGEPVTPTTDLVYIVYHKPIGVEVTTNEAVAKNITHAVNFPSRIFPIGRLDKDSSGLILLTNDGDIVNTVLRPELSHEKEYIVHVDKLVVDEFLEAIAQGVVILGRKTKPAVTQKQNDHAFRIVLTEGRNRQIRRMCETLGYTVTAIKRVRILNVVLGKLPVGAWRPLRKDEQRLLFKLLRYQPQQRS
jgi:23S rRNA pseudouridine2604 synthase